MVVTAVVITSLVTADWRRPAELQVSVALYDKVVIGSYRSLISPLSHRFVRCHFRPTCSHYSEEAMHAYGFPKGLWLTAKRLLRCTRQVPFGTFDPVSLPKHNNPRPEVKS
jgi:hypothetical protein